MMFVNCTKANACADPGNFSLGGDLEDILFAGEVAEVEAEVSPFFQFFVNYPTPF